VDSFGYSPVFVDRQMIIQVLYDKLPDKSKVLTNKGVTEVRQSTGGVEVVTADGETYHGDILVGADGIHSTVREEMWRDWQIRKHPDISLSAIDRYQQSTVASSAYRDQARNSLVRHKMYKVETIHTSS
jgi:2-polyprenyl-6-methoxyphenol hydroxylase-like FAD-dependent oxidoreductase